LIRLSNRVHMFANSATRDELVDFFSGVLGCPAPTVVDVPGLGEPILVFEFPKGGSLSVEFSADSPEAKHGAWLELVAEDADELQAKIVQAGRPRVVHLGTEAFYFVAPGGQVMRIVSGD
jgi:hypothetical protein